jgi:hypothetical protein
MNEPSATSSSWIHSYPLLPMNDPFLRKGYSPGDTLIVVAHQTA